MDLDNILLYEQSPEALEVVKSGNAIISTGGIRRKGDNGKGFLEQAKPAVLSVADFLSIFEGKEHALETDEHLSHLDAKLQLSEESIKEIERIGWLNNAAIQRNYILTHEGFCKALHGLENVLKQLSEFESYVKKRDTKQLVQETQTYINYLRTDAGNMRSKKYSITNSNIAEHLDKNSALIERLLSDLNDDAADSFVSVQLITALLPLFTYVVRMFSALYFYENDSELMPGDYNGWVRIISLVVNSYLFRDKLTYYVNLKTSIPFKDKMLLSGEIRRGMKNLALNVEFDRHYIEGHTKEEYLTINNQTYDKTELKDYYFVGNNLVIFLDKDIIENDE